MQKCANATQYGPTSDHRVCRKVPKGVAGVGAGPNPAGGTSPILPEKVWINMIYLQNFANVINWCV